MEDLTTRIPKRARFTRKVAFFEAPELVEVIERLARESGRSMAAEIRAALRYWVSANED